MSSLDEFARITETELRRAYTANTARSEIPTSVAAALSYAQDHPNVVERAANPIGYLYRVGHTRTRRPKHGFVQWDDDADAIEVDPNLPAALVTMPRSQAEALWLVKACGWTNLQAAEALDVSAAVAADQVSSAMIRLADDMAPMTGNDIEAQLRSLAQHRLALTPNETMKHIEPAPAIAVTEAPPATSPTRRRVPKWLPGAIAVVAVTAMVIAFVTSDTTSIDVPATPDGGGSMHSRDLAPRSDWERPATATQPASTFALARVGGDQPVAVADMGRAREEYHPASTFKPLHALIALDAGVVDTIDTVIPWDGVTRELATWNQDQTLRTAIQESAVWVFQTLAARIGAEAIRAGVVAAGYGNESVEGDITSFWLDGELRTSAIDQLEFFEQLALGQLPFSQEHQAQVQASLLRLDGPNSRISYKTGTTQLDGGGVAWLVGIVDTAEGQWVFAYNSDYVEEDGELRAPTAEERLGAVVDLLGSADVISGS